MDTSSPTTSNLKRSATFDIGLCVLCQKKSKKRNDPVYAVKTLNALKEAVKLRSSKDSNEYSTAIYNIENELQKQPSPPFMWHYQTCRPKFISSTNISRLPDFTQPDENNNTVRGDDSSQPGPSRQLRSSDTSYNAKTDCVVCCKNEGEKLHRVLSYNIHEKLSKIAESDYALLTRLNSSLDSIAGDILYHASCIRNKDRASADLDCDHFSPKIVTHTQVLDSLAKEIQRKTTRGLAVQMSDCWERFTQLCKDHDVSIPIRLQSKVSLFRIELMNRLKSDIEIIPSSTTDDFIVIPSHLPLIDRARLAEPEIEDLLPSYQEDEMLAMVHVALQLRRDLLNQPKNNKAVINDDNCMDCIPESVYMFLTLVMGGQELLEGFDHEETAAVVRKRHVLGIAQDMLYSVSGGSNIPLNSTH